MLEANEVGPGGEEAEGLARAPARTAVALPLTVTLVIVPPHGGEAEYACESAFRHYRARAITSPS